MYACGWPSEPGAAAAILGATDRARQQLDLAPDDDETRMRDRALTAIHPALVHTELERAWSRGREMDLKQALKLALHTRSPATVSPVGRKD